ncbi:MAG: ribosome small subunit-dependent GTPase A [Magnetococcales bacterium]|nr:ribosome small subunit-dependent GTPase A [Magnetococcales bacterium]
MPRHKPSHQLTDQQRRRISSIRERRLDRLEERRREESARVLQAGDPVGEVLDGRVTAHFGLNVEVEESGGAPSPEGRIPCRCAVRETVEMEPVCGDWVVWRRLGEDQGVIEGVKPRRTVLRRPGACERLRTLAANVDRLLVTASGVRFNPGLVDQYLVAAEAAGVEAVLVISKMDLLDERERTSLEGALAPYRAMGYGVVHTSLTGDLSELMGELAGWTSVFSGQSGVGKSTLVARLTGDESVRIAPEDATGGGQGRHTTTVARLYHLPGGGELIDSPGIRSFGLHGVDASEVAGYFRDIAPFIGHCKFGDCEHGEEPGCAVRAAVKAGRVDERRWESLRRIVRELENEQSNPF